MKLNHCENEVIANNSCYQLADVQPVLNTLRCRIHNNLANKHSHFHMAVFLTLCDGIAPETESPRVCPGPSSISIVFLVSPLVSCLVSDANSAWVWGNSSKTIPCNYGHDSNK